MSLEGRYDDETGVVRVGSDARQRYHDSRGYGYPLSGNEIALAPVEAAHLLFRAISRQSSTTPGIASSSDRSSPASPATASE